MTKKPKPTKSITHLKDLTPDPKNARKHNPRNIGLIEKALGEVGAARSIVIDEKGIVLAGNGLVEAAAQAGIERVRVVDAEGDEVIAVRRTGLSAKQKTKLALYDNRATELSAWDADVIASLQESDGKLISELFYDKELRAILTGEQDANNKYSRKIEAPIYEPQGEKPAISDLYDDKKTKALLMAIDKAKGITEAEKDFLRIAAYRHTVLNFKAIANYYAHSSAKLQSLMEDSALVIIDFDKAIEQGFVELTTDIAEIVKDEYGED